MDKDDLEEEWEGELFGTSNLPRVNSAEDQNVVEDISSLTRSSKYVCPDFDEIDALLKPPMENGEPEKVKTEQDHEEESVTTSSTLSLSAYSTPKGSMSPIMTPARSETESTNGEGGGDDKESGKQKERQPPSRTTSDQEDDEDNKTFVNGYVADPRPVPTSSIVVDEENLEWIKANLPSASIQPKISKDIPKTPSQTWDFSLQSLNPDFQSKVNWVEGRFYNKFYGKCSHVMQYVQCPCEEHNKTPLCRLCNIPFCSATCFNQTSRTQQGSQGWKINQTCEEDVKPLEPLPSTSKTEPEFRARPPNDVKIPKAKCNLLKPDVKGAEVSLNVTGGKGFNKENRKDKDTEAQGKKVTFQKENSQRHQSNGDIEGNPQNNLQPQLSNGYVKQGPRAAYNSNAANIPVVQRFVPQQVLRKQRSMDNGLLPTPHMPFAASMQNLLTGVTPHTQMIPSQVHFPPPPLNPGQQILNAVTNGSPAKAWPYSNNSTREFNQPGYYKNNHTINGKTQQTNHLNPKSSFSNNNTPTIPTMSPHAGSQHSSNGIYNKPQDINGFNNHQPHFRRKGHLHDSLSSVKDTRLDTSHHNGVRVAHSLHSQAQQSRQQNGEHESNHIKTTLKKDSSSRPCPSIVNIIRNEAKAEKHDLIRREPDFPHGITIKVKHVSGKSFFDFAGIPIGNDDIISKIRSTLQTCPKDKIEEIKPNDCCIVNAPSKIGGGWNRAIVTNIEGKDKIGVYLLDLGMSTIVEPKSIYKLPTDLLNYRPLAVRVKYLNITADMKDPDVCDYFSSLVENKIVKLRFTHRVPWERSMYTGSLEVIHINKWYDAGFLLHKFQVAERVPKFDDDTENLLEKLNEVESIQDNVLSSAIGSKIQAVLSYAVTVNEFYVSTKESLKRRFKIEQKLNDPTLLSKCQTVNALQDFSHPLFLLNDETSNMRVRVKVLEVEWPDSAIVHKIDYGDALTVPIAELRQLPTDLHETSCVFRCSLPIQPAAKTTSKHKSFNDLTDVLVKLYKKNVILFVFSTDPPNTYIVELALEDNATGCAYSFMKNGLVTLSHDVDLHCLKKNGICDKSM